MTGVAGPLSLTVNKGAALPPTPKEVGFRAVNRMKTDTSYFSPGTKVSLSGIAGGALGGVCLGGPMGFLVGTTLGCGLVVIKIMMDAGSKKIDTASRMSADLINCIAVGLFSILTFGSFAFASYRECNKWFATPNNLFYQATCYAASAVYYASFVGLFYFAVTGVKWVCNQEEKK